MYALEGRGLQRVEQYDTRSCSFFIRTNYYPGFPGLDLELGRDPGVRSGGPEKDGGRRHGRDGGEELARVHGHDSG